MSACSYIAISVILICSRCHNNERNYYHSNAVLIEKVKLSNYNTCVVDSLSQEATIDANQTENTSTDSFIMPVIHLSFAGNTSSIVNIESSTGTNTTQTTSHISSVNPVIIESSNEIENDTGNSDLQNSGNLNHQSCISQDETSENGGHNTHSVNQEMKRNSDSPSIGAIKTQHYKVLLVFAMCCIIGFCMVPIIFYYVSQTGDNTVTDLEYSHEKNISAKVCFIIT